MKTKEQKDEATLLEGANELSTIMFDFFKKNRQYQPYKDGRPKGKAYRHYQIDGKVYKTTGKFLEAINEFNPKIIPKRK